MKIQNYDEAFPYIIIDDYYDEEELRMIWEELEFLSYPKGSFIREYESPIISMDSDQLCGNSNGNQITRLHPQA